MDRLRQNKGSLTNISSLKGRGRPAAYCLTEPEYFYSSGKNFFSLGALAEHSTSLSARTKPSCTCGMFHTTTIYWAQVGTTGKRYWFVSSWLGLAQTLFRENILERSYKFVKEVRKKFRREHCLNPEAKRRLSLRATGHFFDQLNRYLSSWRAFSRKEFELIFHRELRDQRGQTLVELMIAMSVMSIGFLGVFAVLSQSLGLNRVVANQYIAANLAAEGIEVVKNITDSNVAQGKPWNTDLKNGDFRAQYNSGARDFNGDLLSEPLKFNSAKGLYNYDVGTPTNFRRTISIKIMTGDNEMQVKSVVAWSDRGGTEFKVELEDRFFNWRKP